MAPTLTRVIRTRRSIRGGFSADPIPFRVMEVIVSCGLSAPSSKNSRPWRLHAVTDRVLLSAIADDVVAQKMPATYVSHDPATGLPIPRYTSTVNSSADVLREVPLGIIMENLAPFSRGIDGLLAVSPQRRQSALLGYAFENIGIGAALENRWLAAHSLGLGAVFLGDVAIAENAVASRLGLTGDLLGALAVGYSSGLPKPSMDEPALADTPRLVWHTGGCPFP